MKHRQEKGGDRLHMALTVMDTVERIKSLMATFEENADAFLYGANKAAGRRARNASIKITSLMKDFRALSTGRKQDGE